MIQGNPAKHAISIYNSNLEAQKGFFLQVSREMLPVKVETLRLQGSEAGKDAADDQLHSVQNEAFCSQKQRYGAESKDLCQVFIDLELQGLSFSFMQVTLSGSIKKIESWNLSDSTIVESEVMYSYDHSDYFDMMDSKSQY